MYNIWITGANGQLGIELQQRLAGRGELFATDAELDICDADAVERFVAENNIGTVINCAAYTNVEAAEDNADICMKVNMLGVKNLAQAALKSDAALIQISTDYVFDGAKGTPYTESDLPHPLSVYGESKLAGEEAMRAVGCKGVIIRTAWLYSPYGKNFMKRMVTLGQTRNEVSVVCDQIGSPTAADSLAEAIEAMLERAGEFRGAIFNYSGQGACAWSDFAEAIMRLSGSECTVREIKSDGYPQKAVRPKYSYLDKSLFEETFHLEAEHWCKALERNMRRYLAL